MIKSTRKNSDKVINKTISFINEHKLPKPDSIPNGILIALSGGADSVALLVILIKLGYKCSAIHCNFHLRDMESSRDEHFVSSLCSKLAIPLYIKHFNTYEWAAQHHKSIETAARELRYSYFSILGAELGISHIAIGHHSDDSIETLLLNMIRGTGIRGLMGISPMTTNQNLCPNMIIIRPFLYLTHKNILKFLTEEGIGWVDDSTNFQTDFARNKIRLKVMPILEEINPAAKANIIHMQQIMSEVSKVYESSIERDIEECISLPHDLNKAMSRREDKNWKYVLIAPFNIDISKLKKTVSPISVLHQILSPLGFNGEQLKNILSSKQPGCVFHSPTHIVATDREHIIVRSLEQNTLNVNEVFPHPLCNDLKFKVSRYSPPLVMERFPYIAYVDADKVKSMQLQVRSVRYGDTIAPLGMKGKRKLVSNVLTDAKVNILDKHSALVITDDEEIVWIVGIRTSEHYKIDNFTRNIIRIEYTPNSNLK